MLLVWPCPDHLPHGRRQTSPSLIASRLLWSISVDEYHRDKISNQMTPPPAPASLISCYQLACVLLNLGRIENPSEPSPAKSRSALGDCCC